MDETPEPFPDDEPIYIVNVNDPFRWRLRIPSEPFLSVTLKKLLGLPLDADYPIILAELAEFGPPHERMTWVVKDLSWFQALRDDLDGDLLYDFTIDAATLIDKCIDVYAGWPGNRDFLIDRNNPQPPR